MKFFEKVEPLPPDAILGLTKAFNEDKRKEKVNLGVGVYKTGDLQPLVLHAVKEAERRLIEEEKNKDYLPIDGLPDYVALTEELVFGKCHPRLYGAQVVGGTAALHVGSLYLKQQGLKEIYLPDPTWGNHRRIFNHVGLEVKSYRYFDPKKHRFDFEGCLADLEKLERGAIVLLHACCHNPTGFDPTVEQWQAICEVVMRRELFPLFDCAYQGFGRGIDQDVAGLRLFAESGLEFVAAISHSKNFGLYAERTGGLFIGCGNENEAYAVGTQVKMVIRGIYSNPPCHGARLVALILGDESLRSHWQSELDGMRGRITEMRQALGAELAESATHTYDFLSQQVGMFSYTGLEGHQVDRMISDFGIYLTRDGRINVAGLNTENVGYVAEAMIAIKER